MGYRVTARNAATASENRIHADDVARRYGFRGGLVPGVTVYAYASHALLGALGSDWVERGEVRIRFPSPCYDGEVLTVSVSPGPSSSVEFDVNNAERVCAAGSASLPDDGPDDGEDSTIPAAEIPAPEDRPLASEQSLVAGEVLGSIPWRADPAAAAAYLAKVAEPSAWYAEHGVVHPGLLLEGANGVLMANVLLPAWLHVASEVRHRRAGSVGEQLEVRARGADVFERKGHHFVRLDVAWMSESVPVATAHHTAIWQLAAT